MSFTVPLIRSITKFAKYNQSGALKYLLRIIKSRLKHMAVVDRRWWKLLLRKYLTNAFQIFSESMLALILFYFYIKMCRSVCIIFLNFDIYSYSILQIWSINPPSPSNHLLNLLNPNF